MANVEIATEKVGEGLDFFSSLMSDMKTMNDDSLNLMAQALPTENKKIAQDQAANAKEFFDELQKEAEEVNARVNAFR